MVDENDPNLIYTFEIIKELKKKTWHCVLTKEVT